MNSKSRQPAILGGKPAFVKPVPITCPTVPAIPKLVKRYKAVLESGILTNSRNVQEFENKVKDYIGVKNVVAVNSCTSGLMLIMKSLGLTGEVILPSFTFHATAHAIVWNGLKPVFVDCDPNTFNIDIQAAEKAITPNTSAIIGVHIFGNPANTEGLEALAAKYKLKLIFDAAHGFGTQRKGKKAGNFGDAEAFSLSPTKLLTTGEGGIVTTNNDELAKQLRIGRNYGDSGNYNPEFSGFNARMNEFSALLGIESLAMLEKNVKNRNKLAEIYYKMLSKIPGLSFQFIDKNDRSSFKDFSILIDSPLFGMSRDRLHDCLLAENIIVKKYFYPAVHTQKAFSHIKSDASKLINTLKVADNALSLPLFSHMRSSDVVKICDALINIAGNAGKIGK